MKRPFWTIGAGVVVVLALSVACVLFLSHFASTVKTPHTAPGAATVPPTTSVPATGTRIFKIVPAQSTASYSVHEDLVIRNISNNIAVGKTHAVQGSFEIRTTGTPLVANLSITVDLRTLQTDEPMRDHYVRQNYLETDAYPIATFVSIAAEGLPQSYSNGQQVRFQLIGNLTLHGKTNKETFTVQGKVVGNTITGTATSTVYMTDFGIQPPNLANIAIADNKVLITIDFTAQAG